MCKRGMLEIKCMYKFKTLVQTGKTVHGEVVIKHGPS